MNHRRLHAWFLVVVLLWGCDLSKSMAQRPHGPSRTAVGELMLSTWLPAGLDEVRFSAADQSQLADLGLTDIEWLQRGTIGDDTVEAAAMAFCDRQGLGMPVYYEAPGFTPYDKLHNWTTKRKAVAGFEAAVRERVLGLKARWDGAPGFAGFLIGHEDYHADAYPALATTVHVLAQEDPLRPAITVGAINSYGRVERFLDAFFVDGGAANIFQHEHYVFTGDLPVAGPQMGRALERVVAGYDRVARHLRDRHGRWHAIVQVHAETRDGDVFYRAPTAAEIRVQAGLALARGAAGVVYFLYSSGTEYVRNADGDTVQVREYDGLVDRDGAPTGRYVAVRQLNEGLRAVSPVLAPLFFRGGYEARRAPADEPVASRDVDLDLAFFGDATRSSHVLVVSRQTDAARTAELQVVPGVALADAASGELLPGDGTVRMSLEAGGFRLLTVRR